MRSPALRYPKSLWSYNPIPSNCVLYLPLWDPGLSGLVFKSIDPYGHTCTVTGAVYGSDGYTFDGLDDNINCGSAASIDNIFDGGGTIMALINVTSDGQSNAGRIVAKYGGGVGWAFSVTGEAAGKVKSQLFTDPGAGNGQWTTTATEVTLGTKTLVCVTYNADSIENNPIIYVGTASTAMAGKGITEDTKPTVPGIGDESKIFRIGDSDDDNTSFDGVISAVWGWDTILTATEIQYVNLAIRWRYV